MKKTKTILTILCVVLGFFWGSRTAYAMSSQLDDKVASYEFEYSISPGTDEWKLLNHGERVNALQIPEDVLREMTTDQLTRTVLDYPCFFDLIFYEDYSKGIDIIEEHFNGLKELLGRSDAAGYLLSEYAKYDISEKAEKMNSSEFFETSLDMLYAEAILAKPIIYSSLNEEELTMLELLVKQNYEFRLRRAGECVSYSGFYDSLVAQQNASINNSYATVTTPNGTTVSVIVITGIDTEYAARNLIKASIEENYPGAVVVGDSTNRYNCHAYAWANSTSVWMNNPSAYWTDGSYVLQCTDNPSAIGQKAYYPGYGNEHSGKVIRLSGNTIRSKWGSESLVEHSVWNCPYYYIPLSVKFYG